MLPKKHLSRSEKRKKRKCDEELKKSQQLKFNENLDQSNESLHNNINENDEINDPNESNDVQIKKIPLNIGFDEEQTIPSLDIYDPRNWANLNNKTRDILVEKRPIREINLNFPLNNNNKHFSYAYFSRKLNNGEISDRKWLVYSKHIDKVFCFCCKLFKSISNKSLLANKGLIYWKHISERLKQHENSAKHMTNTNTWNEMSARQVLFRIFSAVKCLATHNLAFRDPMKNSIKISNEFEVIMQDHVRHIQNREIHYHYLGHKIQNELISLLADSLKKKYFLVFLKVDDTSELRLFNELQDILKSLDLSFDDVRGQSYDNGSSIKRKHQGVQNRIKSVKAIRFQTLQIRSTLSEFYESCDDAKSKSETESLSKSMCIDTTIKQLEGVLSYFEKYRDECFTSSMNIVKSIALDMNVEPTLPTKRCVIRKKKLFDENNQENEEIQPADELFRNRFEQLKTFESIFEFLFDSNQLNSLDEKELRECCATFHSTFCHGDSSYVDLNDLLIFLTVPVTLKLIKTYLSSLISQKWLNGLAILSIEKDF
ncbi:hypothetical protein ES332_A06G121000v1 [Gossypium tomentosum]|uniref:TTF-type domain-containing protein n=1 Tax=Gossypium tomentosum TaxID=34277 RepID=A0A5D2Q3D8_GOSTO|nr:hypothetical protein ES332_A06G121000v1 [Gossypium tomentosum]